MNNTESFILPSGKTAKVLTELTYGQKTSLEDIYASAARPKIVTGPNGEPIVEDMDFDPNVIKKRRTEMFNIIVLEVLDENGQKITGNIMGIINNLSVADGQALHKKCVDVMGEEKKTPSS